MIEDADICIRSSAIVHWKFRQRSQILGNEMIGEKGCDFPAQCRHDMNGIFHPLVQI